MHLIPKYIIDPRVWTLVHQESVRKTPTTSNNQELPRITNIGSKSPVFPQHCTAHWDSYRSPGRCASAQWGHCRQHGDKNNVRQTMSKLSKHHETLWKHHEPSVLKCAQMWSSCQAELVMSEGWCYMGQVVLFPPPSCTLTCTHLAMQSQRIRHWW
jgi:hypothetical protein